MRFFDIWLLDGGSLSPPNEQPSTFVIGIFTEMAVYFIHSRFRSFAHSPRTSYSPRAQLKPLATPSPSGSRQLVTNPNVKSPDTTFGKLRSQLSSVVTQRKPILWRERTTSEDSTSE